MKRNDIMVLALAVVAAFAMVSVAGIAVLQSDDSDAAGTEGVFNPLVAVPTGPLVINASVTNSYDFYVNEDAAFGALVIVVTENANYSGTLRIGILTADKVYTPYTTIEMKGASAVQLTAMAINTDVTGFVSLFEIGNLNKDFGGALPQGDFEVKQGQVMLGSSTTGVSQAEWEAFSALIDSTTDINGFLQSVFIDSMEQTAVNGNFVSFSGKISAGEFSATANYVAGTIIALDSDGKARVSGLAVSPNEMLPYDTENSEYPAFEDRTLIFEGKASIQFPEAIQKLLDRNLGSLDKTTVEFPALGSLESILGMTGQSVSGSFDLFITDSVNVTVAEGAAITSGDRTPSFVAKVSFDAGADVNGAFLIGSDGEVYSADVGTATAPVFSYVPFGTYTLVVYTAENVWYGTNATVSESGFTLGSNKLSSTALDASTFTLDTDGKLEYDPANHSFGFAFNTSNGELGTADADAGKIVFKTPVVTTDEIVAVLKAKTAGSPLEFFVGTVNTNNATGTLVASTSAPANANEIKAGDIESAGVISAYVSMDTMTIVVKGEMNFLYTSDDLQGLLIIAPGNAKLTFEGEGVVSQGVVPQTNPDLPDGIAGSTNLVAAYYFINEPETGTPTKSTYYFTSLANAITKSNEITLLGKHVILEDTTLDNPEFDTIRVILGPGASLEVGDGDVSPVLTVPGKTTVVVPSDADHYEVVSGQAVYEVKPESSDEPQSDILITGGKFIYTDLATALDISVSGDVLELRRDAELKRDATVKDGVELDDRGYAINIPEEITLTVDGTLKSAGSMEINGTIRINGEATFTDSIATFGPSGAIDITSSGTLTVDTGAIFGNTSTGAISVAGKIFVKNDAGVSAGTVIVTGNVSVTGANSVFSAFDKLVIGEVPTLSPVSATYTNTASITGAVTLEDDAVAYVYGDFPVGTGASAKIKTTTGDLVKTAYNIEGTVYVTLYTSVIGGSTTEKLPVLFEDQLKDIKILGWNNERLLRGDNLVDNTTDIGAAGWENVYADWEWKMYDITLSYLQGMTWIVDGVNLSGGGVVKAHYGQEIVVTTAVQPGFEGTPVLKANGNTYTAGTAFEVKENTVFTATGVQQASGGSGDDGKGGLTLIEILLIVIVVIIAVIAIIVAIRLMRS
ncbi:MAG: hypothetical protein LBU30_03360 [Candidatus Methanoplasma sp.]|jgi:hypothetical protein|nr:hypothetical protein [Candidatus Methanoplasma sp.]